MGGEVGVSSGARALCALSKNALRAARRAAHRARTQPSRTRRKGIHAAARRTADVLLGDVRLRAEQRGAGLVEHLHVAAELGGARLLLVLLVLAADDGRARDANEHLLARREDGEGVRAEAVRALEREVEARGEVLLQHRHAAVRLDLVRAGLARRVRQREVELGALGQLGHGHDELGLDLGLARHLELLYGPGLGLALERGGGLGALDGERADVRRAAIGRALELNLVGPLLPLLVEQVLRRAKGRTSRRAAERAGRGAERRRREEEAGGGGAEGGLVRDEREQKWSAACSAAVIASDGARVEGPRRERRARRPRVGGEASAGRAARDCASARGEARAAHPVREQARSAAQVATPSPPRASARRPRRAARSLASP